MNEELQEEVENLGDMAPPSEGLEQESEPEERDLEKELLAAQNEVAEHKDKVLRLAADFENSKKRMERERSVMLKYAGENIFRELLPVVDNLERAVEQGKTDSEESEQNLTALLEGVDLTLKSLKTILEKFEVKAIDGIGQPFDPNKQEALTMEASDTVPANHVAGELVKGYYYKDRLLRAAKVIVSSGKPAPAE